MNWTNYDRLVRHLETMPPEMFNYDKLNIEMDDDEPACVACQCRILSGDTRPLTVEEPEQHLWDERVIENFLKVNRSDANYLYIPDGNGSKGVAGIRTALRRLSVVALKYPRPSTPEPVTQFVANDAAFLSTCRALASLPIEVDAE